MKKSELTQITQILEQLVAREVRKQLPGIISETFHKMMSGNRTVVNEQRQPEPVAKAEPDELDLKTSLKEMFGGKTPTQRVETPAKAVQQRKFTKDPVLNQILSETVPLSYHERSRGQSPAFLGQYQQAALAAGASIPVESGESPAMPSRPPIVLREGQESAHQPMAEIPDGISALDVARSVPLPTPVAQALTRNYSQMMKIIDKKKKGVVA